MARWIFIAAVLLAMNSSAQIYDPDDYVNPRGLDSALFTSRLLAGVVLDPADEYRPLGQELGVLQLANSLYWRNLQFDFKHIEARGSDESGAMHRERCGCSPRIYFPTAPSRGATPNAPLPGRRETFQVAWYHAWPSTPVNVPPMRYRLTTSWRRLDTIVTASTVAGPTVERLSGGELMLALDADTFVQLGKRELYGVLRYARTESDGTTEDRTQNAITYTARLTAWSLGRALVRGTLTLGGVSGRGANGINVVNPALELFLHEHRTRANLHIVLSPQVTRSGPEGWTTTNQVALLVDRELVWLFSTKKRR